MHGDQLQKRSLIVERRGKESLHGGKENSKTVTLFEGKSFSAMNNSKQKCGTSESGISQRNSRRNKEDADSDYDGEMEMKSLQQTLHKLNDIRRLQERDARDILRKQRQLIGSLKQERESLISGVTGFERSVKGHVTASIRHMQHQSDDIDDVIAQEKQTITNLQQEIKNMEKKIEKERIVSQSSRDQTRRIQTLTGKLQQVNRKLNAVIMNKCELRHDIDTLRADKRRFTQIHSKLEKKLHEIHEERDRVLNQASESLLLREETRLQTVRAAEQQSTEEQSHKVEMQELLRELYHTEKRERFLQEKNRARQSELNECETAKRREACDKELHPRHQMKLNEYEAAMEKISNIIERHNRQRQRAQHPGTSQNSRSSAVTEIPSTLWESVSRRRSTLVEQMFRETAVGFAAAVEVFRNGRRRSSLLPGLRRDEQEHLREIARKALEEQKEAQTEQINSELLYHTFMEREDVNFTVFRYISEQNRQLEMMKANVEQLRRSLEQEEERQTAESRSVHDRLHDVKWNLVQTVHESRKLQTDVKENEHILNLLHAGIESLCVQAGLDLSELKLYSNWTDDSVTEAVLSLIGQIELSISELLRVHAYIWSTAESSKKAVGENMEFLSAVLGRTGFSDTNPNVCLPAASFCAESEEEYNDEELKPLSRDELQQRALKTVRSYRRIP